MNYSLGKNRIAGNDRFLLRESMMEKNKFDEIVKRLAPGYRIEEITEFPDYYIIGTTRERAESGTPIIKVMKSDDSASLISFGDHLKEIQIMFFGDEDLEKIFK